MRKIIQTFILTGLGYATTILYTYIILANAPPETIGRLNKYESVLAIIAGLISLGVVQDTSRNIAKNPSDWRGIYHDGQRIRLFLAILISAASLGMYAITRDEIYLLGLASLAMALSGEYALYALGRPVSGSFASFLRALTFSTFVIIVALLFDKNLNATTIMLACSLSFVICGAVASSALKTSYFITPKIASINTAKTIGTIALFMFAYNNIKPAIILVIPKHLSATESAYYFEVYKLYFIFFSIRRVLVQTLYKEIITNIKTLKYDLIIAIVMVLTLLSMWLVRIALNTLNIDFPGLSYAVLRDVSIITLMSCIFSSSFTRLFALNKDILIAIPILFSVAAIFIGMTSQPPENTSIHEYIYLLGASELVLSVTSFILLRILLVKK